MTIYPAIDLLDGACVRLARGSFEEVTVYADDPAEQAERFATQGSHTLHVVDLDGARTGEPAHLPILARIRDAAGEGLRLLALAMKRSDDPANGWPRRSPASGRIASRRRSTSAATR